SRDNKGRSRVGNRRVFVDIRLACWKHAVIKSEIIKKKGKCQRLLDTNVPQLSVENTQKMC
ncbi:MAG: hypothetical protein J6B85_06845, partial [Lachnospiraceae bacterium]|nr:hypothetical protein [Lachnospiraceae bacterium]